MNWIEIKNYQKIAIPLQIDNVVYNYEDNKQWLAELICIKQCNHKYEKKILSLSSVDANN